LFFITSFRRQDDEDDGGVCCAEDLTEGISVGTTSNVTSCLRSSLPPVMLLLDSSDIVGTDGRWGVADPLKSFFQSPAVQSF